MFTLYFLYKFSKIFKKNNEIFYINFQVSYSRAWIDKVINDTSPTESAESIENAIPIDMN